MIIGLLTETYKTSTLNTQGVPKNTAKCEYEGKEYHVGKAYDAKDADGKNVTVWCTDADTVVTCTPEVSTLREVDGHMCTASCLVRHGWERTR